MHRSGDVTVSEIPADCNPAHAAEGLRPAAGTAFPLILTLDTNGIPHRWITWQHACFYYAKDQIAWTAGENAFTVFGGINRVSGERSRIVASSIIAIKGKAMAMRAFSHVPPLNNYELFHRDRYLCAYCGRTLAGSRLTRDHIIPFSLGGRDSWMNVVTACRGCNERKSNRTPEMAKMELIYLPYVPNRAEYLILTNRRILADQMGFLAQHVPAQSRLHQPVQ
jgi:hypothetical protein